MRQRFLWLASLTLFAAGCADETPSAPQAPAARVAPLYAAQGQPLQDEYIVVLQPNADPRAVAASAGVSPRFEYHSALNGFAATLNPGQLNGLSHNPNVEFIEADQVVTADFTQTMNAQGQPWGLDRIDQRTRPLSLSYTYNTTGTGVTVYIIDTGLTYSHTEFGGRASFGFDALGGNGSDCNGHGTHVGGSIGGSTYGVAKTVGLVAVRVLGCNGSGSTSGVIAGVDWVKQHHPNLAVANMSLGGGASTALDQAVTNSINSGVTYAVAAGNSNTNACNQSPARTPAALTVAATDNLDRRPTFSNYGTCVDLFAPGVNILSAYKGSNTATAFLSGTSMASPHVAGVAALYKQLNPSATPAGVANALNSNATMGLVQFPGVGTPNRLLYMGFLGGSPPPTQQIAIGSGNNQSGTVGTTLPQPLVARVTDGSGNPVVGVLVTFTITAGGGSVSPGSTTTNSQGNASTQLTLGSTAVTNTVKAALPSGAFVTFSASATNPPAAPTISIGSGNNQSAQVSTTLPQPLVAHVANSNGPVSGVTVTFQVTGGGGSLTTTSAVTNAQGDASTSLTLGPNPGDNAVLASITGSSVTFHANGTAPTQLSMRISILTGNNQNAPAGTLLPGGLRVLVRDPNTGLPVVGVAVTFEVMTGGGSVSPLTVVTNANGWATSWLTLGPLPGQNTVKASIPNGGFVTFVATGT